MEMELLAVVGDGPLMQEVEASRCGREELIAEEALVERAKADRTAFAQLYRQHYRAIAGYVYRRVGDPHLTDDLVADVFLQAMQGLPRYRSRGVPILAWFYRIATNRVNRWARRERRRAYRQLDEAFVDQRSFGDGPSAGSDLGVDGAIARAALLTLPPRYQAALALHYLEGLSIAEAATALGCREGTVKSRLSRGREALRRRLEQRRSLS